MMDIEAKEFADLWRSKSPKQISGRIQSVWRQTLIWMRSQAHMSGFDDLQDSHLNLDDNSPYGVAKHFYRLFESHFLKNQYALLRLVDAQLERGEMAWLDEPVICMLDIGTGTGAASLALLDLLCEYHEYRWNSRKSVWDYQVTIAAIEPSVSAFNIYEQVLDKLQAELTFNSIKLTTTHITDSFPDPNCVRNICTQWSIVDKHLLLTMSSNVIRPMMSMYDLASRLIRRVGAQQDFYLGDVFRCAYDDLISHFQFQHAAFIDIAAERGVNLRTRLVAGMRRLWEQITGSPSEVGSLDWWAPTQDFPELSFINNSDSYYGKQPSPFPHATTRFYLEIHVGRNRLARDDVSLDIVVEPANLELAWARSRVFMLADHWTDEVEVRLGDFLAESFLSRLRRQLLRNIDDATYSKHRLPFFYPKNNQEDRPRYFTRLPEQITFAAASQAHNAKFGPAYPEYVLGNRINKQRNEFFYESWFEHFRTYSQAVRAAAQESKMICKVDIKSYYASIPQGG